MNEIANLMNNRMSVRHFDSSKSIDKDILNTILQTAQQSPTYINGQQYSIIVVDDLEKRKKIANATISSAGKPMQFIQDAPIFLLFVIDFNKIDTALSYENNQMLIQNSIESLLIGTVDIGISIEAVNTVAQSFGIGSVMVGAIRKIVPMLIEEFKLPKYTFPLLGISLGYPVADTKIQKTPRLSLDSLVHYNVYEKKDLVSSLQDYNTIMKQFFSEKRGVDMTWTQYISQSYTKVIGEDLLDIYRKQGFSI